MANGKLVNTVNSVHRRSYTTGDLRFTSRRARGRPRLRVGVGKAPAWLPCASGLSLRPKPSPFFAVSLPLFSRRHCRSSVEPAPSLLCSTVADKLVPTSLTPCAYSRPTNSACLHRELELHRLLPRGRQPLRRARFVAARAPWCISVLGFG